MPTKPSPEDVLKDVPAASIIARIGGQVMHKLGSPSGFRGIKVYPICADTYRVNVMVGKELATARVADSFFLTADAEGNVVSSSPEIVRLY